MFFRLERQRPGRITGPDGKKPEHSICSDYFRIDGKPEITLAFTCAIHMRVWRLVIFFRGIRTHNLNLRLWL